MNLQSLSKARLLSETARIARTEQALTIKLLFHLNEIARRKLHLDLGYQSLWEYCTKELKYSSSAAGRRIAAARCIRRFPEVLAMLETAELNLCAVAMIEPILNEENAPTILERVRGASRRQVEKVVNEFRPPVALRDWVRPVRVAMGEPADMDHVLFDREVNEGIPPQWRHRPTRISDKLYVQFLADEELVAKFEEAKALMCGRFSGMSFADVLDVLVTEFLNRRSPKARHERREAKKNATSESVKSDKKVHTPTGGSARHIPAAVRDEVYVRDGGQCTFKATSGKRCESRKGLEIDHIVPVSAGGTNEISNLRLLCPAHNLREGERTLGERLMAPFWRRE